MARGDGDREPISLEQILAEVAGQRRLRGKISLLARRWQEVRSLDPRERERVAAALGSQAAWNRLEAYFGRDGTISEAELAVKETLERAAADPGRVREVVRRARSGDYRGAAAGAVEIVAGDAASEALADAVEPEGEAGTDAESEPSARPPVIAAQESGEATEEGAADETQPEAEATEPEPSRETTVPEAEPERSPRRANHRGSGDHPAAPAVRLMTRRFWDRPHACSGPGG